jgi:hypothetical protein
MHPRVRQPDRRQFLTWAPAAAAILAAHEAAGEKPLSDSPSRGREEVAPRIVSLELLSSVPPTRLKEFYHGLHG